MKIYIAGKIAGDPLYRRKFLSAGRRLYADGHVVLNPASLPEGLAFRLADVVLHTLAVMQELGLDIDKVVTAEFDYLREAGNG